MAYLNCPYCPSQAVPANTQTLLNNGLTRLRCIGSGHFSFVYTEDLNGERQEHSSDVDRQGVDHGVL